GQDDLSQLKEALVDSSFTVDDLNLAEKPEIPDDASVIAIVGPTRPLLDMELEKLRAFTGRGGRLLIAADPGQSHNLALLTKTYGIEFKNTYILSQISRQVGKGMATAIGLVYDPSNAVTKKLTNGQMTVFDLA